MTEVVSPGHKLGQMIGNFFEELFAEDLVGFCGQHGFYCDRRGLRPKVRGTSRKVTWIDKYGNKHDLDYMVEKNGSHEQRGVPVAFIELAWRRYTKHSRNKTGELEGSLLHLRDSYPTCRFLGAILAGEYTDGGKNQLTSHGITVLHVPFEVLAACFRTRNVELDYPEDAPAEHKRSVIQRWEALSERGTNAVKRRLRQVIAKDYSEFKKVLEKALLRNIESVRVLPLYGSELVFSSVLEATRALTSFEEARQGESPLVKFEVQLRFSDGDRVEGAFRDKQDALNFLRMFS